MSSNNVDSKKFQIREVVVLAWQRDVAVYLAGPFAPDWRRQLLSRFPARMDCSRYAETPERFPILRSALPGGLDCTGPWRVEPVAGHGIMGVPTHHNAWSCEWNDGGEQIVRLCREAIVSSDFVFCWLPETQSVPAGTLWEIGFAAASGVPVVLARPGDDDKIFNYDDPDRIDDYWFPVAAADFRITASSAGAAWEQLIGGDLFPRLLRAIRHPEQATGGSR